jgi:DNA-binding CsgD family transcriptional regulator
MNSLVPTDKIKDPELRNRIEEKLSALQDYENDVPAVLIVHLLPDFSVLYMSRKGLQILGTTLDEIRLGNEEYHARYFNPEDAANYVPKILGLLERNDSNEFVSFFQQVRPSPDHEWVWYLSSTRIFLRDGNGKPVLTLTMAIPIDAHSHITTKVERLMQENLFLQRNQQIFSSLTRREKQILRLIALGQSTPEIANALNISGTTAATHRRNLRNKLNAQSNYDITRFAQAFDLI